MSFVIPQASKATLFNLILNKATQEELKLKLYSNNGQKGPYTSEPTWPR
jgi:hypothetical protein